MRRIHPLLKALRHDLSAVADPARAPGMQAYMKSAMPYHGVPAPLLRQTCRALFRDLPLQDADHWQSLVLALWRGADYREERYAAIELSGLARAAPYQTPAAMPLYEEMIVSGAWWDYVDALASLRVGPILRAHPDPMQRLMREWSRGENLWKRRTSILCQLGSRQATDVRLLYDCIEPSLASREFFLRKAIGWALRQYARIDAAEVVRYVTEKGDRLSPLSRREALKRVAP